MKVAAIQLESKIADVAENLSRCEQLGDEAAGCFSERRMLFVRKNIKND